MNRVKTMIGAAALSAVAAGVFIAAFAASSHAGPQYGDRTPSDRVAPRCLDAQRSGRFHVVDDHTLVVYDDMANAYKLDVGGPCRSMDDMSHFGFELSGSTQICRAHDAFILYSHFDEPSVRCTINGVTPLTRDEAASLDQG